MIILPVPSDLTTVITGGYCDLATARAAGVAGDDDTVGAFIEAASRIVDTYTGRDFLPQFTGTVVVTDVRSRTVFLPTPWAAITAITIDREPYPVTQGGVATYDTETWGVRLARFGTFDADGFLRSNDEDGFLGGWNPGVLSVGRAARTGRASTVTVTGTFGYVTPPRVVALATGRIAALLTGIEIKDPNLAGASVEGYTRSWSAPILDTTGDLTADRLLRPYRRGSKRVG